VPLRHKYYNYDKKELLKKCNINEDTELTTDNPIYIKKHEQYKKKLVCNKMWKQKNKDKLK
jgi:hypothetical protein